MRRVLSLDEIDALRNACRNDAERALVDNLLTGARLFDIAQEMKINRLILWSKFKKICARAKMPRIAPHDLRRKFYQFEIYVKGGYDFSALSRVMEVVK